MIYFTTIIKIIDHADADIKIFIKYSFSILDNVECQRTLDSTAKQPRAKCKLSVDITHHFQI